MTEWYDEIIYNIRNDSNGGEAVINNDVTDRMYIGASSVGHNCTRNIALRLRGYPIDEPSDKLKRIFAFGHQIEPFVAGIVEKKLPAGYTLIGTGDMDEQAEYKMYGSLVRAHSDGIIVDGNGNHALLEIKTANSARFKSLEKLKLRVSMPSYYDQMMLMMGIGSMEHGVFVAINKDNAQVYAEHVEFDDFHFSFLKSKIETIIDCGDEKLGSKPTDFTCAYCSYTQVCWHEVKTPSHLRTCRQCKHCTFSTDETIFSVCDHADSGIASVGYDLDIEGKRAIAKDCDYFEDYIE